MESVNEHLIIGGTTKSATTSVFRYLGDHDAIQPSSMKETRFFLDDSYPLNAKYTTADGIDKYYSFFRSGENKILLEASPDYLYSSGTACRVSETLHSVKWIFILRNPIERMKSWYAFSKQNNLISSDCSLDSFIDKQHSMDSVGKLQFEYVLDQGLYSRFLKKYLEIFGTKSVHIVYVEDLRNDPIGFMKGICSFVGVNSELYNDYEFEHFNTTRVIKNPRVHGAYQRLSLKLRQSVNDHPALHNILRRMKSLIFPLYLKLNQTEPTAQQINEADTYLQKFYASELELYDQKYQPLLDSHVHEHKT